MDAPFAWPGGKRNLRRKLLELIPSHQIYVEVFCGSAKLFFGKEPSPCEVLNDRNGDVANFFRIAKHRAAELAERFDHEIVHAERFRELRGAADSNDEVDRALRFAYLVRYSYGAKGEHFASSSAKGCIATPRRRPLDHVRGILDAVSARLRDVLIEQRDFAEILVRYDSPETFFYLDPPYVHCGNLGQYKPLPIEKREEIFSLLATRQAKWLMSFDDCEEVRSLARKHRFRVRTVSVAYSVSHTPGSRAPRQELLISPA